MEYIKTKLKNTQAILAISIYGLVLLFSIYPYRDYDWGWHYRYGEYFLKHFSPYLSDTFSWTLEGYRWINHSWLYDPLLYLLFSFGGFLSLSIMGAITCVAAFYFCLRGIRLKTYQLAILAFFFCYLTSGVVWQGIRSQVVGLLLIAINGYMLRELDHRSKKYYLILPLLYLLWANLHGSWTYGIILFSFFIIQKIFFDTRREKGVYIGKNEVYLVLSFIACIAVTLINPFGVGIYLETFRHFSNPLLKYILEWGPVQFPSTFYFTMIIYAMFSVGAILLNFRQSRKINFFMIATILASFYLAFTARRYVAVAIVGTLPFIALTFQDMKLSLEKFKSTQLIIFIGIIICIQIVIFNRIIPWRIFNNYSYADYCSFGSKCSEDLTDYLIKNPARGRGLNYYDWGGYMIGRGVPAKLFIDGRMHLWRDKNGYSPFLDFQKIYYEDNLELFNKYNFDWAIISSESNLNVFMQLGKVKGEWVRKYSDQNASYYVRERGK